MIARTEIIKASTDGQLSIWRQARAQGLIPEGSEAKWITTPDDRLCPVCAALDGETVPVGSMFVTALGPVVGPPAHPNCRCAIALDAKSIGMGKKAGISAAVVASEADEAAAVKRYTAGGYKELNAALRSGKSLTEQQTKDLGMIEAMIARSPDAQETLYRGLGIFQRAPGLVTMNGDDAIREWVRQQASEAFPVGSIVELGGLQSTSRMLEPALDAAGGRRLQA